MADQPAPAGPAWPDGRISPPPGLSPEVVSLAEDSNLHHPLGPGDERLEDPRYVVYVGPGSFAGFTVVQRLRLEAGSVDATVREVRALLDERGRTERTWEVGSSATPADLAERLLDLGMEPHREPYAVGMLLDSPPQPGPSDIDARPVRTAEEYVTSVRIAMESFEMSERDLAEALERSEREWEPLRRSTDVVQFLAWLEGEAVATGRATFTPFGVLLNGGSTLKHARGRGAYRALVAARWEEAVRRGVPRLVTQAGAMSRPILSRLGFREICDIRILRDGCLRPEGAEGSAGG